jgi:hypothetical protein
MVYSTVAEFRGPAVEAVDVVVAAVAAWAPALAVEPYLLFSALRPSD